MAGKPPLRAVGPDEKPPAPKKRAPAKRKPRSMAHAAKLSRKTFLETLRDRIAAAMDDPRAHPRDVGNLGKQLFDVQAELDKLGKKGRATAPAAEPTIIPNTPAHVRWDEDAI